MFKNTLRLICFFISATTFQVVAQSSPIDPSASCAPIEGQCMVGSCFPGDGGAEIPCIGFFCPPTDDGGTDCDPTAQSCVSDGSGDGDGNEEGDGECEGSDCGDNSCAASGNVASDSSGAQSTSTTNPINLISGNKYKRQEDLAPLPGVLGLEFVRHYNSSITGNIGLGAGWRHSYSVGFVIHEGFKPGEMNVLKIQQSDGRIMRFNRVGDKKVGAQYATRNYADGFISTNATGYQWRWRSGRILSFDDRGWLVEIKQGKNVVSLQYSARGQLLSVEDPQGRRLTLNYVKGLLTTIVDPAGQVTKYKYASGKQLLYVERPTGKTRFYHYEDKQQTFNLTGITDERNIRIESYRYDDQGRAVVSTKGLDIDKVEIKYEPNQRVVINGLGESTTYILEKVNGQDIVKEIIGPGCSACSGSDVSYDYNDALQVVKVRHKSGLQEFYEYDDRQRKVAHYQQTLGQTHKRLIVAYEYEKNSPWPSKVKQPSIVSNQFVEKNIIYNKQGQPLSITENGYAPETNLNQAKKNLSNVPGFVKITRTTSMKYDGSNQILEIDGPREGVSDVMQFAYTESGYLKSVSPPSGVIYEVLGHDISGRPTKIKNGQQPVTEISYNHFGKPERMTKGQQFVSYDYNEVGGLTKITDQEGNSTNVFYDDVQRVSKVSKDNGPTIEVTFDKESRQVGNRISNAQDETLNAINYFYDAESRMKKIASTDQNLTYEYTEQGVLKQTVDQDDQITKISGSNIEQLLQFNQPNNVITTVHFDKNGQKVGLTDANGNKTLEIRDDFNRIVKLISPDTGITLYEHDSASNIVVKQTSSGTQIKKGFDAANRLVSYQTPNDQVSYDYDPITGKLSKVISSESTKEFLYNEYGQLISHIRKIDKYQFETKYKYNDQNKLVSKVLPDGQVLIYHYHTEGSNRGQLKSIEREGFFADKTLLSEIDNNKWDGQTNVAYGNGLKTIDQFNSKGKLTSSKTNSLLNLEYAYDFKGNIKKLNDNRELTQYSYDYYDRLINSESKSFNHEYEYDKSGNLTLKNAKKIEYSQGGRGNQIVSIGGEGVSYNQEGSTLSQPSSLGLRSYEYNANQRPIHLYVDGEIRADYHYNGFGERIKKAVYHQGKVTKVTYYLYDGQSLSAEVDGNGKIVKQYLYHQSKPVVALKGKTPYYIHSNHLGAPRVVTDSKQNIVWQARYNPFGGVEVDHQEIELNLRFPGQYEDKESGTYYNYFRDYDPQIGRYLTSDPIGLGGGINTYAYVQSNPLNYVDPIGLFRLVIGIEANDPTAFAGGVHNLFQDTGHAFLLLTDNSGTILNSYSFGPARGVDTSDLGDLFLGVPGTVDFPIGEDAAFFEYDINTIQYGIINARIDAQRNLITPRYTVGTNTTCASAALGVLGGLFIGLPDGDSPINIGQTVPGLTDASGNTRIDFVNPYALFEDLMNEGRPFVVADPSSYTTGGIITNGSTSPTLIDSDSDGTRDIEDAFPSDATESTDTDGDGVGDNADEFPSDPTETTDIDGDGVGDNSDAFPVNAAESVDTDGDGVGDNADAFPSNPTESVDSDGDGVGDNSDVFPSDASETLDLDRDGVGNNADVFPSDATESADADGDGVGDNADLFPTDATESADTDGDGVGDNADLFPTDATESIDTDGDGVGDNSDLFPTDAAESIDTDGDGIGDNADAFPSDPAKSKNP